jgi:hypothetical protein
MSVDQIAKFVEESINLEWRWNRITIIGGEPTLHPSFFEIVNILSGYRPHSSGAKFWMYSNGYGARVKKVLSSVPSWIKVLNTNKTRMNPLFSAYNVAPIDIEEYKSADFSKACCITEICGLGLTRYGYYPCGAGGSIDRVFGFDIGLKNLEDVAAAETLQQLMRLCAHCGHYKDHDSKLKSATSSADERHDPWVDYQVTSESWKLAYERFKLAKPELSLY